MAGCITEAAAGGTWLSHSVAASENVIELYKIGTLVITGLLNVLKHDDAHV